MQTNAAADKQKHAYTYKRTLHIIIRNPSLDYNIKGCTNVAVTPLLSSINHFQTHLALKVTVLTK